MKELEQMLLHLLILPLHRHDMFKHLVGGCHFCARTRIEIVCKID